MKKMMVAVITLIGVVLATVGIGMKMKGSASIATIGGADGPTAIFVAGSLGDGLARGIIAAGIVVVISGVVIYKKCKKNKK